MKRTNVLIAGIILFASCNNAPTDTKDTPAKDTAKKEAAFVPVDSATAAKNWQAYMTPGEMHKMIASWNGTWNAETTMWMEPGAPPMKSMGKTINKTVLNGLYQESVNTGNMMGMPFEGHGTMGYDNAKKLFVSSWIDNMGSGIIKLEGPWDAATKSVNFKGMCVDPSSGKDCAMREVFKVIDDNTQLMEMYGPNPKDGKEMKMMEIKFTRAK